jgi:hypothetical protein
MASYQWQHQFTSRRRSSRITDPEPQRDPAAVAIIVGALLTVAANVRDGVVQPFAMAST